MERDYTGTTFAVGDWLYDGAAIETVEIVAFNFDFWFEFPGDDGRGEWKPHPLNEAGLLYYVRAGSEPLPTPFYSAAEAKRWGDDQP
jgi:hypothetical protein